MVLKIKIFDGNKIHQYLITSSLELESTVRKLEINEEEDCFVCETEHFRNQKVKDRYSLTHHNFINFFDLYDWGTNQKIRQCNVYIVRGFTGKQVLELNTTSLKQSPVNQMKQSMIRYTSQPTFQNFNQISNKQLIESPRYQQEQKHKYNFYDSKILNTKNNNFDHDNHSKIFKKLTNINNQIPFQSPVNTLPSYNRPSAITRQVRLPESSRSKFKIVEQRKFKNDMPPTSPLSTLPPCLKK